MSCRSTASGSLGTTYIVQRYGLTDAQSTSLYHELMRDWLHTDPLERVPVSEGDYRAAVARIAQEIGSSPEITERMRTRLLQRLARVNTEAAPADEARRYAITAIDDRARQARTAMADYIASTAFLAGVSEDEVQREFNRLSRTRGVSRDEISEACLSPGMPLDAATAFAAREVTEWAVQRRGNERCDNCGQWCSPDASHICPERTETTSSEQIETNVGGAHENSQQTLTMERFQDMYDGVLTERASGHTRLASIPHLESEPGGVTGGLGAPGSGMSFGIELEVDFPNEDDWGEARETLALTMYEEGIGLTPHFQRWHFVGDEGAGRPGGEFQTRPDGWVCEFDRSVDGLDGARGVEIKSQILYDEPETWRNLRRICQMVEELGGQATPRCGLHVNVNGSDLPQDDPTFHSNIIRLSRAYDDVMIRMAHNPESGPTHRGRQYCAPAYLPPNGYQTVSEARASANHYQSINLNRVPDEYNPPSGSSRVEMRLFDSTLDPNRIQTQVALSLALVNAAKTGDRDVEREAMLGGTQKRRFGGRRLEGEEWEQATEPVRALMSLLERNGLGKPEQQTQFARLFAASRWQAS